MSHRKVCSQGSIPFSWEDSPGVSKIIHQKNPIERRLVLNGVNPLSSPAAAVSPESPSHSLESSTKVSSRDVKLMIPLPPCPNLGTPRRSNSLKGYYYRWWRDDPFLAAYKECTKTTWQSCGKGANESKKSVRKTKLNFSCKNPCDVEEDNLVRLSKLPLIPSDRVRGKYVGNYMDSPWLN